MNNTRNIQVDDDDGDSNAVPNPRGEVLGTFFSFSNIFMCLYIVMCVHLLSNYPKMWFFKVPVNTYENCFLALETIETRFTKVETYKTPLEQSSLILSI